MTWSLYYLFLLLLFFLQTAWQGWSHTTPDLLVGLLVAVSVLGRTRKIFALVLPLALLRAGFSADPSAFVLAFFALGAFLLQEFRAAVFPERIEVQFALAFFVGFAFFTLGDLAAGGVLLPRREAVWSGLYTASLSPILFFAVRSFPLFRPLLDPR